MKGKIEEHADRAREDVRGWIRALGIRKIPPFLPNLITLSSILITAIASFLIATAHFSWAFIVFIASQFMDALDGAFAREYGLVSPYGAFLDSTVDRVNEFLWYLGMVYYFQKTGPGWALYLLISAMFLSFMVSYTRARLEGVGVECRVGVFTRMVRIYIMSAAVVFLIYSRYLALGTVAFLALGSLASSLQRVFCGIRKLKER